MAQFSALPAELHLQIASTCSPSALAALCRTSRLLNTVYTGPLYANVDLRRHNCPVLKLYDRQSKFLRTLKCRLDCARYVHCLKWTLIVLNAWEDFPKDLPLLPSYSNQRPKGLWEILLLLTEVTSIEIDEFGSMGYLGSAMPQGLSLFPKASTISIGGLWTDLIAHTSLTVSKAYHVQHLRLIDVHSELNSVTTIGLLRNLTGKCANLKTLIISESDPIPLLSRDLAGALASSVYGDFLESLRETLVTFRFNWVKVVEYPMLDQKGLEMASNFDQVVRRGTWPHLKKVTIAPIQGDIMSSLNEDWGSIGSAEW